MSANSLGPLSNQDANKRREVLNILESNWQAEMRGHYTYETLADREKDPVRLGAFRGLASAEKHHADLWAGRIRALQGSEPVYGGSTTGEADTIANRVGGMGMALRRLELGESRDIARYAKQLKELGDGPSNNILTQILKDEREHYQILSNLIRNRGPIPQPSPSRLRRCSTSSWRATRKDMRRYQAGW